MPFTRASLTTITQRIKTDFETRITGATSLLRRSFLGVLSRVLGGAVHLLYEYLDYQAKQLFVSTADGPGLETHASEWGITRNAAVAATGSGTATGVAGTAIPAGSQLTSTDSQTYSTDALATIGAGGSVTVDFTADTAGEAGNDDPSISLTFVTPIPNVDTTVTVDTDGITGGLDEEDDDALRARVLTRKRQPPQGGAESDFEKWALEVSGVTRAWTFPEYYGAGTIGFAFVRDNDASIIPDSTEIATVRAYFVSHTDPGSGLTVGMPVTMNPGLVMLTLTLQSIDFNISLSPNTSAVQATVQANLEDLILRSGGPGETLYVSRIREAISLADGETNHILNSPAADVAISQTRVAQLGTITFSDI